jgi:hypothetical protein
MAKSKGGMDPKIPCIPTHDFFEMAYKFNVFIHKIISICKFFNF